MSSKHYYMWHCPACNRGLNNDHRQCLTKNYRFNGGAWEQDCLDYGYEAAEKDCLVLGERTGYWVRKPNKRVVLPPGTYYIGDGDIDHPTRGYDGCFTNGKDVFVIGKVLNNRRSFIGSDGLTYGVCSGFLGIFSLGILASVMPGSYHTFSDMVEVIMDDGLFRFVGRDLNLAIDTRHGDTLG